MRYVRHQVLLAVHMNCMYMYICDIIDTRKGRVECAGAFARGVVRVSLGHAHAHLSCYILNLYASRVAPVHATGSWKFQEKKMPFLRGLIYFVIFCGFVPWFVFFRSRCPFERFFSSYMIDGTDFFFLTVWGLHLFCGPTSCLTTL